MVVNLISPEGRYDKLYIDNYASLQVKDTLARLPGVGNITIFGARDYSMRIWLDPEKVAYRGLTANDVVDAIREQNVQVAAGVLGQQPMSEGVPFQFTVNAQGRLTDEEQFGEIVIKTGDDGQVTRVRDVARVELAARDYSMDSKLNGQPNASLGSSSCQGPTRSRRRTPCARRWRSSSYGFRRGWITGLCSTRPSSRASRSELFYTRFWKRCCW